MEDNIYIEKESVKKMIQRLCGATKCEMIALLEFMPRVQMKTNEDVISRSDAIKWFEPYADRGLKIPVETVIQNLKDIPSVETKQGEWIPCSEGLPSENGTYIVTEKRFAIDDGNHQGKYQTLVEEVDFRDGRWNRAKFFEVVAWQQRPEPWEGA